MGVCKYDTFRLYKTGSLFKNSVRIKVVMKESVDIDALRKAVNIAITRYPYFNVALDVDESGAYVLKPNAEAVHVMKTPERMPALGSDELDKQLIFVDCSDRYVYFNISHSLAGGKGIIPWVMTSIYQYVTDYYHVQLNSPGIRKPDSPLLPTEDIPLTLDMLPTDEPFYTYNEKGATKLIGDYLNGLFNPFKKREVYWTYSFEQKDIMKYAKMNDSSVSSFISIIGLKALDKVLPAKCEKIGLGTAHNPTANFGLEHSHMDILSHVSVIFNRSMAKWNLEKLGTMIRGQVMLQTDPTVSAVEVRRNLEFFNEICNVKGLSKKRSFARLKNPLKRWNGSVGTYIVEYVGQQNWGDLVEYMDGYYAITDGHMLLEITSMENKIFVTLMQLIGDSKYVDAFNAVLDELNIKYEREGPFDKRLPAHKIPKR